MVFDYMLATRKNLNLNIIFKIVKYFEHKYLKINFVGETFHLLSGEPGREIQYDETCRPVKKKQKGD